MFAVYVSVMEHVVGCTFLIARRLFAFFFVDIFLNIVNMMLYVISMKNDLRSVG